MSQKGKFTVVKWDNNADSLQDISSHVLESNGIPLTYDELEESGYGQDHSQMKGQGDSSPTLKVKANSTTDALFVDDTTGALKSDTARTLRIEYGNNAAPTTGDTYMQGEYLVFSVEPETAKDGLRAWQVSLRSSGGVMPTVSTI